jgi:hypothetical protein
MRTLVGVLCVLLVGVWLVGCEGGEGGKNWFGKEKPAAKEAPAKDAPKAVKPAAKEGAAKEAPKAEKPVAKEAPKAEKPVAKEAPKAEKPVAKEAPKTEKPAPMTDAAKDAAAKEAQPLLDKTSAAIKDGKLDAADESLKKLEGMKDSLPKSMQDQIGSLRKSLDAARSVKP